MINIKDPQKLACYATKNCTYGLTNDYQVGLGFKLDSTNLNDY